MLTRVALFEGAVTAGGEEAFFDAVRERLEPIWRRFPHVLGVRVLRTRSADAGSVPVVMILEMDFESHETMRLSLASDIKTEAHEATLKVLAPFSGRFFHLVCENRPLPQKAAG